MNEMDATTVARVLEKDSATIVIRPITIRLEQHGVVYGLPKFIHLRNGRRKDDYYKMCT